MPMQESFDCQTIIRDDELLISLCGDLDAYSVPLLQQAIDLKLVPTVRVVTLDCDAVKYVDSAFIQLLMRLNSQVKEVRIVNASRTIRKIFVITGLDSIFLPMEEPI